MRHWLHGDAEFSSDRRYRYVLTRVMNDSVRTLCVIGLNPSRADETRDDPTVRRCVGFALREGFGRLLMMNLFALRTPSPAEMKRDANPVGPLNDERLLEGCRTADLVLFAWGNDGAHRDRDLSVVRRLGARHCLGLTARGCPKHPLYLRADAPIVPYTGRGA